MTCVDEVTRDDVKDALQSFHRTMQRILNSARLVEHDAPLREDFLETRRTKDLESTVRAAETLLQYACQLDLKKNFEQENN